MSRRVLGSRRGDDANRARPAVEPPPDGEQSRLNRQGDRGRRVVPHPEANQYCRPTCHAYTYTHLILHCVYMYAPATDSGIERTTPRTPPNKGRRYPAEVLTPIEIQALLDACSLHPHTELRNRAFLTTLYRTGMRCSEALALEPKDVDFFNTSIRVLHGKGDRSRTVGVDPGALDIINEWIAERERRGFTITQPLFCTRTGKAMPSSYVREFIKQLGARAGIAKRVHAHGLRHTHAYELMMEGIPVSIIQRQLGHSSLATTDTYLSHIAPQQVIDAIAGREWLSQAYTLVPPTSPPLQALI
jgi:site-specific recombinase XerD